MPDRRLITYCTNIHPGETWAETFAALADAVPAVKAGFAPEAAFPVGLRLSACAAAELERGDALARFMDWLAAHDCFVPFLNGFPYGAFTGGVVKDQAYLPDWRSPERLDYTLRLARLLARLLPEGLAGSVSTVPLGFRRHLGEADMPAVRAHIAAALAGLARLRRETGREIVLALEPEPACVLETTDGLCAFVSSLPDLHRDLVGICLDACHHAVQFEEPGEVLARLAAARVRIARVQASSAMRVPGGSAKELRRFKEPRYLHQVVVRGRDGSLARFDDLPEALAARAGQPGEEWRCHFHLPLWSDGDGAIGTTRQFLEALLPLLPPDAPLEAETYTWDVLPPDLRREPVGAAVARELRWLAGSASSAPG